MQKIKRHFGMDWLRIGAFGFLIFYHIGMFFVPWGWHIKTQNPLEWLEYPMLALNPWRIPLLFLVSGYASRAMLSKPGMRIGNFFRQRSSRLLIPLAFGILVFVAPQPWIELRFKAGYSEGFLHFWLNDYFSLEMRDGVALPTYNHLWFVLYLFAYTAVAAALIAFVPKGWRERSIGLVERSLSNPVAWLLGPILFLGLCLFLIPAEGLGPQIFVGDWYRHVSFFGMFGIGYILAGSSGWWPVIRKTWAIGLVIGVAGYLAMVFALGQPPETPWRGPLIGFAQAVQAWGLIAGLIGAADRFLNIDAPLRSYLSLGVFPFYIVHQTIIILVGYWAMQQGYSAGPQAIIITLATLLGCWLFYEVARRSGILRPLAGLAIQKA